MLKAIVKRCGKYLKNIEIKSPDFSKCALFIIAKYCPNIQSIICNNISIKGYKKLTKHCRNITELTIFEEFEEGAELDEVLGYLFY